MCVSLWLCVFVCVNVRSYMKSVVPCSLVTLFAVSFLSHTLVLESDANRHSWNPDKVLHHLVTLRSPWLDLVSGLPVLHVVMLHADVLPHLYLFICFNFSPQVTECETAASVAVGCLLVHLHA